MFFLGSFLSGHDEAREREGRRPVPFPMINPKWGQDWIDAPIDGYMISKKPKNLEGAKKLVTFLGGAKATDLYLAINSGNLGANKRANTSKYSPLQRKGAKLIVSTNRIAPDAWTATRVPTSRRR